MYHLKNAILNVGIMLLTTLVVLLILLALIAPFVVLSHGERLDRLQFRFINLDERLDAIEAELKKLEAEPKTSGPREGPQDPTEARTIIRGTASVYSRAGCLGCSRNLITASGEPLDDSRLTLAVALPLPFKLGTQVKVTNEETGLSVVAVANDTGGMARYNRIADLSLATAQAIGCNGLCTITLERSI